MGSSGRSKGTSGKRRSDKKIVGDTERVAKEEIGLWRRLFRPVVILILAVTCGVFQRNHVSTMFENDRHFSHLSDMEREMTFRTEMGLYYSYFKTMVKSATFSDGLQQITQDNVTEYGHTINTLKRFNLYPELILAAMFRAYLRVAKYFNVQTQQCWQTNRGHGLDPIISCEGMGNQYYFYINWVFAVSGLVATSLFLYGVLISDSIIGGFIAVAAFFFNHGEATRVQWTPPLRENFAYPIFLTQMLVVSFIIKQKGSGIFWSIIVAVLTTIFMLFWQFSSFALSTQVGSIFVAFAFGYIPAQTVRAVTVGLMGAFVVSFVLLFGNEMLLTSLFLSSLITSQIILSMNSKLDQISLRLLASLIKVVLFGVGTLGIKICIGSLLNVKDDAHIFDILRSKFTNYSDFHTRLYTCAVEFDFMQTETIWRLTKSAILPAGALALILTAVLVLKYEWRQAKDGNATGIKPYGEIIYNAIQMIPFAIMAVLIMRLKLFFTPHLCIIVALLASRRAMAEVTGGRMRYIHQQAACVLLIALMAVEGVKNLQTQWSIKGEYSNMSQEELFTWIMKNTAKGMEMSRLVSEILEYSTVAQEELFTWIMKNTAKEAVFAGSMPTMANLKLTTERAIVNHPHYEDAGLRQRTMNVYSIFSRKPAEEVHQTLKEMQVNYVIFEYGWCTKGGRPGCSLPEVWDLHDEKNRGKTPLCDRFQAGQFLPFVLVHQNDQYKVLKVQ